jgi:hypothetical protein
MSDGDVSIEDDECEQGLENDAKLGILVDVKDDTTSHKTQNLPWWGPGWI